MIFSLAEYLNAALFEAMHFVAIRSLQGTSSTTKKDVFESFQRI